MVEIAKSVNCPDCGAPLKFSAGEAIVTCEYCGSTVNLAAGTRYLLAHSAIPNRLARTDAERAARSWMSGGFLKPDDLASKARIESAELAYIPFFVMRVVAETRYAGLFTRAGPAVRREGTLRREYFWKVLGRRASSFPTREYDIPLAAKAPFDLSMMEKGALFVNAEMDDDEAVAVARQEVEAHQRHLLADEIDSFERAETTVEVRDVEFLHAPIWTIRYEYRKRMYELLLDGHGGAAIKGEIPKMDDRTLFGSLFGR